jgi:hypothetical protein
MRKVTIMILIVAGMLLSCKHKNKTFGELSNSGLTVQIMQLKNAGNDSGRWSYDVRLIPDKQLSEDITSQVKTAMYYRMDSCFYISNGSNKLYASMVQRIPNGIAGNYEYLLDFEMGERQNQDSVEMVYQDKYINHKTYQLKLAKQ